MMNSLFKSASLLIQAVTDLGYEPYQITDYGVFYFDTPNKRYYVYLTQSDLNSDLSAKCAKDKNVTHKILEMNSIQTVPYVFTLDWQEADQFLEKHQVIIRKPVFGMRGIGVEKVNSYQKLHEKTLVGQLLEQYIQADEYRYMVISGKVMGVRKKDCKNLQKNFFENISQDKWGIEMHDEALKVTQVMDLGFAAVDFLYDGANRWVLEVNSAPGLWTFEHPDKGEPIKLAQKYIEALLKK